MNRRMTALQTEDDQPSHEVGERTETVSFGYRGAQYEAEMDAEEQRALEEVLNRFVALASVKD